MFNILYIYSVYKLESNSFLEFIILINSFLCWALILTILGWTDLFFNITQFVIRLIHFFHQKASRIFSYHWQVLIR